MTLYEESRHEGCFGTVGLETNYIEEVRLSYPVASCPKMRGNVWARLYFHKKARMTFSSKFVL
jgi:hypothetical protein